MWKVLVVNLGKFFKIWRVLEKLIQNLTRCKKVDSKSDTIKNFLIKIWQHEKNLFEITLFTKTFSFKIVLFRKKFFFKIVLFKYARKTQNLRILRGKMRKNVIFVCKFFFKIVLFKNIFFSKIVLFKKLFFFEIMLFKILLFFKIWRVVKFLIRKLTRRDNFNSKSDAL